MNCAFVICYSDILLILKADTVFSFRGRTVMSALYLTLFAKRLFSRLLSQGLEPDPPGWRDHLLNYRVTLTLRCGVIYKGHYILSVHNSNKYPGHSRMITFISVIRLFGERESAVVVLFVSPELISGCK